MRLNIKKIVLDLGGLDVELTIDEARELRELIDGFLKKEIPYVPLYPPVYTLQPYEFIWSDTTVDYGY